MNTNPSTHVLVVDDQSGFRELLKRFLEPAGYAVHTAVDAHDALASIADSAPAVAILDIHMPGPNGLWLANQIRAASPRTAMVLATSDESVPPVESMKKGVVAYIIKPLQRDAVLAAVSDAFHWFADESKVDLSRLGVPTKVEATQKAAEPRVERTAAPTARRSKRTFTRPVLVAAVLILAALLTVFRQRTPARALDHVAEASGVISVEDAAGQPVMQGSGFFVSKDTFVTNHHVIKDGSRARIVLATGGAVVPVAGLVAVDRDRDLVLLKTSTEVARPLNLNVTVPGLGESIFVYGAPRGLAGTLSQGIVSAHRPEQGLLQITAPISPGSSGSPVLDAAGSVVAVVSGSREDGQGLNFAIPAVYVLELVNRAREPRAFGDAPKLDR